MIPTNEQIAALIREDSVHKSVYTDPTLFKLEMERIYGCLLYTSPSPRDLSTSRMPSSA